MNRLIKDAGRKVYLILDNLKVHHSKDVTKWLEKKLMCPAPDDNPLCRYLLCSLS
jgi:hypothetical protein